MNRSLVLGAVIAVACNAGPASNQTMNEPCTADEVLNEIAKVLVSGDTSHVGTFSLRVQDLMGSSDHVDSRKAAAAFDESVARQNTADLSVERYRGMQIRGVKPGTVETHVHVEGTEFFVDRIYNSEILLAQPAGTVTVIVDGLAKGRRCWKLEHFGTGVARMQLPNPVVSMQQRRIRNPEGTGFRKFSTDDFCSGLAVYRSPSQDAKIGTLVEGYRRYRDPKSGRLLEAVLLQSLATGHVRGIWMSQQQLLETYVNRSDHHLQDCSWSVREKEVSPLPDETPVQ